MIGSVLGCSRRQDPQHNQVFVDASIPAARREYHYYVGYAPGRTAVHIVYRKHLLCGHEQMDELLAVEQAFERDPAAVTPEQLELYRRAMAKMVTDLVNHRVPDLVTVEPVSYEAFEARLERLRQKAQLD